MRFACLRRTKQTKDLAFRTDELIGEVAFAILHRHVNRDDFLGESVEGVSVFGFEFAVEVVVKPEQQNEVYKELKHKHKGQKPVAELLELSLGQNVSGFVS